MGRASRRCEERARRHGNPVLRRDGHTFTRDQDGQFDVTLNGGAKVRPEAGTKYRAVRRGVLGRAERRRWRRREGRHHDPRDGRLPPDREPAVPRPAGTPGRWEGGLRRPLKLGAVAGISGELRPRCRLAPDGRSRCRHRLHAHLGRSCGHRRGSDAARLPPRCGSPEHHWASRDCGAHYERTHHERVELMDGLAVTILAPGPGTCRPCPCCCRPSGHPKRALCGTDLGLADGTSVASWPERNGGTPLTAVATAPKKQTSSTEPVVRFSADASRLPKRTRRPLR